MSWLGLDIGGANLKAATTAGWARTAPFALWRDPDGLSAALAELVESAPCAERIAVTMTGELCDCFRTKSDGVRHIVHVVQRIANGRETRVYLVNGQMVAPADALQWPHLAAASNWRALAQFASRYTRREPALLIDIGSTTTDIIPLLSGEVAARGCTDLERLARRELIYSGVGRTPICAIVQMLPLATGQCPIAAEMFATTADAYLVLGEIEQDCHAAWTADGRPLTREHAHQRLARQLCADAGDFEAADFERIALAIRQAQLRQIVAGIDFIQREMQASPKVVILSGSGEFIAREAVNAAVPGAKITSLLDCLGSEASRCAPAYALAMLASEQFDAPVPSSSA